MGIAEKLVGAVASLPLNARFPGKTALPVQLALLRAGAGGIDAQRYLSGGLLLSAIFAACALAASLFLLGTAEAAGAFLLSFALPLLFFLKLPSLLAARREKLIEAELPFLLRELAVYIDIGLPFEKAIARSAKSGYALCPELSECDSEIKSGSTLQSALSHLSAKSGSIQLKRACMLLSSIYETGAGSEPLRRAAEEMSGALLADMRLQSGRFSLLAVGFIAVSALIPSFFTVYSSLAPFLAAGSVAGWQAWLAFIIVFPFLDAAVLCAMLFLFPPLSPGAKSAVPVERGALLLLAALSLALAALFHAFSLPALSLLSLSIAPCAYFAKGYSAQKEIDEAELRLPDALYSAASTHKLLSPERMLSLLAKGGFGRISEAFEIALGRMKAGEKFELALAASARHCPSPLVRRAFSLLVVSYQTGANMYFALREAAQDAVSFFTLVRERSAMLSVQRYTILASCAFLVPAILGSVAYLAPALSSAASFSGAGGGAPLAELLLALQCYLAINAALSSSFLGLAETQPSKAALYFALCAPVGEAVFLLVSSGVALGA